MNALNLSSNRMLKSWKLLYSRSKGNTQRQDLDLLLDEHTNIVSVLYESKNNEGVYKLINKKREEIRETKKT